jgi:hypothetical protein
MKLIAAHPTKPWSVGAAFIPFLFALWLLAMVGGVAHATSADKTVEPTRSITRLDKDRQAIPPAPPARSGPLSPEIVQTLADIGVAMRALQLPKDAFRSIAASGDARLAWYLFDLARFAGRDAAIELASAFEKLTGSPMAT